MGIRGVTRYMTCLEGPDGYWYVDTPGLLDVKMMKEAAEEITKALKLDGNYRVFFILGLDDGRLGAHEKFMISTVLKAAPDITTFSVILNRVEVEVLQDLNEDPSYMDEVKTEINEGLPSMTDNILLIERMPEYNSKQDMLWNPLPCHIKNFVVDAPRVEISKENVSEVDVTDWKDMVDKQQQQLNSLRENVQAMKNEMEFQKRELQKRNEV